MEQETTSVQGFYEAFIKNLKDSEDDRVKNWFLMDSFSNMIIISTVYVISCKYIGPALMKDRKPLSLKKIIVVYNILQILFCSVATYEILKKDLWAATTLVCDPDEYSKKEIIEISYWILYLKMVELVETVFFVLRKKQSQVSNLHLYHHSTTFIFVWIGLKYNAGIGMSTFILMNSLVHILMYAYYTIAAVGSAEIKRSIKPFKKYITIIQMVQFTAILLLVARYTIAGCVRSWVIAALFSPNVMLVYWMFYDFYRNVYKIKRS